MEMNESSENQKPTLNFGEASADEVATILSLAITAAGGRLTSAGSGYDGRHSRFTFWAATGQIFTVEVEEE
jgi:hypothetical protein